MVWHLWSNTLGIRKLLEDTLTCGHKGRQQVRVQTATAATLLGFVPRCMQIYMNSLHEAETELEALLPAGRKHKGNLGEGRGSGGESEEDSSEEEADDPAQEAGAAWEQGSIKVGGAHVPSDNCRGATWRC